MPCSRGFPHTLRPVPLSREVGVTATEEEEGRMAATQGTTPVINQLHNPQHHIGRHIQIMHVSDTMETLLQIEGKDWYYCIPQ